MSMNDKYMDKVKKNHSYDTLGGIQDWLGDRETDEYYTARFDWVNGVELSETMQEKEEELQATLERARKEKEKKEAEDKKKKEEEEKEKAKQRELELQQALEAKRLQELEEKEMTKRELAWLKSWQPDISKPSQHLVARRNELQEAEKWLQSKLSTEPFRCERTDCDDEVAKKEYEKYSRTRALTRQPSSKINGLVRKHARRNASFLNDPWDEWSNKWEVFYKKEKEREAASRSSRGVKEQVVTAWDDPKNPPGLRSLFYHQTYWNDSQMIKDINSFKDALPENAAHRPNDEEKWCENATKIYRALQPLVENCYLTGTYKPSAFNDKRMADASSFEGVVTQRTFWAGEKLGFFKPTWDATECKQSLDWLPAALRAGFHMYLESFFELSIQPCPLVKKAIFAYCIDLHQEELTIDDYFELPRKFKYAQIWRASRELFEDYSDHELLKEPSSRHGIPENPQELTLVLKEPMLRRHAVPDLSQETKEKSLEELERESAQWVSKKHGSFWRFRHQIKPGEDDWKFDAEKILAEKDFPGENGYFNPAGPPKRGDHENEENEIKELSGEKRKAVEELCNLLTTKRRKATIMEPTD